MNSNTITTNALCFKANCRRHALFLVLALAVLICIPQIALAGSVTAVKIKDDTVNVGQNTKIKVKGTGQCQKVRLDLDGKIVKILNHNFSQADYITNHSWNSSGTKTVKAIAKKDCTGTKQDTVVVVDGTGKPKFEKKKDYMYPKVKPKFGIAPGLQVIVKPKIESALVVPAGSLKAGSSPGILRPGFKLYLKGKYFGTQPGKILMSGAGGFVVELTNVTWESNTKVNGVVPISTNGQPNQSVKIRVVSAKVPKNMFDVSNLSNPWNMSFEGREDKVLLSDAVTANCGTDGNINVCNGERSTSGITLFGIPFSPGCPNDIAICGYHSNKAGAVGDDTGFDGFSISLKNGWKFKNMQKVLWKKTSGDEVIDGPKTPLPVGQPNWDTSFWWVASPNDHVSYQIKVIVEGPLGTSYK